MQDVNTCNYGNFISKLVVLNYPKYYNYCYKSG